MPLAVPTSESSNEKLRVRAASLNREIAALLADRTMIQAMSELAVENTRRSRSEGELYPCASSLDQDIAALLADCAVVQEALDAIVYPVLTLPFEITSEIFRWTLGPRDPPQSLASQQASLRLGHICRLWREIALSTRELWNTLDIVVSPPSPHILVASQYLARTFLSRAASSPLNISLSCGDADSFRISMLDMLIPYSRTWANMRFNCHGLERLEALPSIHHQLPALTSLTIHLGSVPDDGAFSDMFNDAPLLRNVSVSRFGSQHLALPWAQLTSLTLHHCSGDHFVQILGWTPNLVHLVVGSVTTPPTHVLVLSRLQSVICADEYEYGSCASILSLLDARCLRALKLCTYDNLAPLSPPMLHPASLEQLSVDILCDEWVAATSIECLVPMTSLRNLKIVAHDYDPRGTNFSLVPFVVRLIDDRKFLPQLESLTLILQPLRPDSDEPSEFDMDTISNMLCVRSTKGLRHFELRSRGSVPGLHRAARALRASGMQIILESQPGLDIDPFREEF
ncbi:hypothetical protein C8R46DRAFT_955304 [Mycena filopes]|nr:hypothetical protein C8R46DRAFT_955304 [Mycena filopes]